MNTATFFGVVNWNFLGAPIFWALEIWTGAHAWEGRSRAAQAPPQPVNCRRAKASALWSVLWSWGKAMAPVLSPLRFASVFLFCIFATGALACSGCGCRGGPGYRGPDGRCVGFANMARVCGDPPETRCVREAAPKVGEPDCRGCGCKGGPGYRNPDTGQCVGWQSLRSTCGDPPNLHCTPELRLSGLRSRVDLRSFFQPTCPASLFRG